MLPIKQQRFTRKRRREGSAGEGVETDDGKFFLYDLRQFNIIIITVS